jgi:diaminohydroxyphosphoribosylaminopyrimidine deaminase / 5-amino-6-(5-phosphoribosylamino)uracil reductase
MADASTLEVADIVGRTGWEAVNQRGRPFVLYKLAATLDGRVAAADGTSRWITSAASRAEVQRLRAACHATVVGSGTQRLDDPSLAVHDIGAGRQPLRVVVDSNAQTPPGARVLDDAAPTLIAVACDADARHLDGAAHVLRLPRAERGLDLQALLGGLAARGVRAAFLEGGPTLAGSFVAEGLVDRVVAYVAPAFLGAGRTALGDAGIGTIGDVLRLRVRHVGSVGDDVRIVADP